MTHPKMLYTYVGVDSHKDTHTAVFIDCFFEKVGEITFANLPPRFGDFLSQAERLKIDGTELLFGLEDISAYGRQLAVFLRDNKQQVKHVNALLVARERKNQNITHKTDSGDAECAARVLLSKFGKLPDADPIDKYLMLRTIVVRRDFLVKTNTALKNSLHNLLVAHYPLYSDFFQNLFCKSSLAFFMEFPSPPALNDITAEELAGFFYVPSSGRVGIKKAGEILDLVQEGGYMHVDFQEVRDEAVRSTIRQIEYNLVELESIERDLAGFMEHFDCTLTSMNGIDTVTAAQVLSCIGDIKRFSTSAKLARYSGVAPVSYSSGKTDMQYANSRGNRELNSLFYCLAVRVVATVSPNNKAINPFFYEYYHRKLSEGKTKKQALKCVQRRLVNIIWTMLTNNEEYVNPPMFNMPKEKAI
jgi:transposase